MRLRNRREKGRAIAYGAATLSLAIALLGAVPMAFAQGDDGGEANDPGPDESAFRLGHVAIECFDTDAADDEETQEAEDVADAEPVQESELALGEARDRTYCITNRGEASYIRIASHTVAGELVHANDLAVTEEAGAATVASPWRFAGDGYWYRAMPLEVGETITVRVSVEIPSEERWKAALGDGVVGQVTEMFDVQALQARNKVIDLESPDPWGEDGIESPLEPEAFLPEGEGGDR